MDREKSDGGYWNLTDCGILGFPSGWRMELGGNCQIVDLWVGFGSPRPEQITCVRWEVLSADVDLLRGG